jgi:hypothetical protein
MKKIIVLVLAIYMLPFHSKAQKSTKTRHKHKAARSANATILPQWAAEEHYSPVARAYFADYYSYYDPQRGGYIYWENGKSSFTPAASPYLENMNDKRSEVKLSKALSLDLQPELEYPYYMTQYPLVQGNGNSRVPVPAEGNPVQR